MIYSNIEVKSKSKEMPFGTINFVAIGEYGRGRREMRLACPADTVVAKGMNENLTIGLTKTGNPRINVVKDNELYLILSSEGGYTRRGCGWIGAWKENKAQYQLLSKGNGADGLAGRIGTWDVVLLHILGTPKHDWIRVRTSGAGYGTEPELLYLNDKDIISFKSIADAEMFIDQAGLDSPDLKSEDIKAIFKDVTW